MNTICGKDYLCKKSYKAGNCSYTKGHTYHCMRDGYLNDDNNVSWSCTESWCDEALKEVEI